MHEAKACNDFWTLKNIYAGHLIKDMEMNEITTRAINLQTCKLCSEGFTSQTGKHIENKLYPCGQTQKHLHAQLSTLLNVLVAQCVFAYIFKVCHLINSLRLAAAPPEHVLMFLIACFTKGIQHF